MSSEHQYAMHFFLIFLLVCLGAPASEGMVSAFLRSVIVILNSTSQCKLMRFYVLLIRQEANGKIGDGRADHGNGELNLLLKQLACLFIGCQL